MRKFIFFFCAVLAAPPSFFFSHRLDNAPTPEHHQPEAMPGGVAAFDFDGDGWLDLVFANAGGPLTLYRNNRDASFTDCTMASGLKNLKYSMGVATADFDNDGRPDLFLAGLNSSSLWRNLGGGRFAQVEIPLVGGWAIGAGWFDYDRDGDLDLFIVRYVRYDAKDEIFCGAADFSYRTYCHPKFYPAIGNILLRNDGNGHFTDVSVASGIAKHLGKGMAVVFGDADQDGWLDAFVTNDTTSNFLFRNQGDGTFEEIGLAAGVGVNDDGLELSSMGADFRDLDGDGNEDIFVSALANESFPLFRNLGKLQFMDVTYRAGIGGKVLPYSGWATGAFDFDNDGQREILVANGDVHDNTELFSSRKSKQPSILLKRNAKGVFESTEITAPAWHRGAAFGDFGNDGQMEAVITRLGDTPIWWKPVREAKRNWLGVVLMGSKSNSQGLGAMVRIKTQAGQQWNRATTAVGYASASDPRVHFGLGSSTAVEELEVRWPSGKVQLLKDVKTGQYLKVREP